MAMRLFRPSFAFEEYVAPNVRIRLRVRLRLRVRVRLRAGSQLGLG
jgi:hypothetical protein